MTTSKTTTTRKFARCPALIDANRERECGVIVGEIVRFSGAHGFYVKWNTSAARPRDGFRCKAHTRNPTEDR